MTHNSPPLLLALHAVRCLGFADTSAIVRRTSVGCDAAIQLLGDAEQHGWVHHDGFARLEG